MGRNDLNDVILKRFSLAMKKISEDMNEILQDELSKLEELGIS